MLAADILMKSQAQQTHSALWHNTAKVMKNLINVTISREKTLKNQAERKNAKSYNHAKWKRIRLTKVTVKCDNGRLFVVLFGK